MLHKKTKNCIFEINVSYKIIPRLSWFYFRENDIQQWAKYTFSFSRGKIAGYI